MDKEKVMQFAYDFFRLARENGLKITVIDENEGVFSVDIRSQEPDCLEEIKPILDELLSEWKWIKNEFDVSDKVWRMYFKVDESLLDNYKSYVFTTPKSEDNIIVVDPDVDDAIEDEDDVKDEDDLANKIVEQKENVTVFADGSIEVELKPWEFECVPKQIANLMPMMKYIGMIQTYDWVRMVGLFLGDDDFKENELIYPDGQSGRWLVKGTDQFGSDHYFEIHDTKGGDVPQVYGKSKFGIDELLLWIIEKFKDCSPVEYTKKIKLPGGEDGEFGIDDQGNPWHTWNRCPWLKEMGF